MLVGQRVVKSDYLCIYMQTYVLMSLWPPTHSHCQFTSKKFVSCHRRYLDCLSTHDTIWDFRNYGDDLVGNSCFRTHLVLFNINFHSLTTLHSWN